MPETGNAELKWEKLHDKILEKQEVSEVCRCKRVKME